MLCSTANVSVTNSAESVVIVAFGVTAQPQEIAIGSTVSAVLEYVNEGSKSMSVLIDGGNVMVYVDMPSECNGIGNVPIPSAQVQTSSDRLSVTTSTANGTFSPDTAATVTIDVTGKGGENAEVDDVDGGGVDVGSDPPSGLSTGAMVGIVMGSIVCVVLMVVLAWYFIHKTENRRLRSQ